VSTVAVLAVGALGGGFVTGLAGFGTGLTALGLCLHGHVNDRQFRAVVLWLLLASGVVLMVSNFR
jgi:hypothetical protein